MDLKLFVVCTILGSINIVTTETILTTSTTTTPRPPTKTCGYQSCHPVKEGFINVHLVPHTHDDVGWLKTVDQYYYGSRTNIQNAGVQYIIESVIDSLKKDPNRRFIYVETAYFWKWWIKQHDRVKSTVRRLVNNGQLEFIGGGWSMNDEAATHYQSIIDQFSWGLRKLNESFGSCGRPKIGWQIDPFGHSREMASIFAQLGFDGFLLGRIDYQEKSVRLNSQTAEMVWKGSNNLGEKAHIFTGAMYNTYSPPKGFCFDILCSDDPIIDDKKSPDYNVNKRVDDFFAQIKNMTKGYATNNVIVTMGEDFNYQDANVWFKNMDLLIKYANERQAFGSKYNLIYSTPSCYVKAVYDETKGKKKWLTKSDDFFPYASDPHSFWTGYFTSRPTIKRFEREGNNFLQVCKQLYALADLGPEDWVDLNVLREAMGVMQHHDAVTGTEKEHVAHDYARILTKGFEECENITKTALSKIIFTSSSKQVQGEPKILPFKSCLLSNVSSCPISEVEKNFIVTVYNPLSRPVTKYVRLPVLGSAYTVMDPNRKELKSQIIPIAEPILTIPGRKSEATVELIFALELPPLGFKTVYVTRIEGNKIIKQSPLRQQHKLGNAVFDIDKETGFIVRASLNNVEIPLSQEFLYYEGFVGNNEVFANRSSGAYIFRPRSNVALKATQKAKVQVYIGPLVGEVHQIFNEYISQIIRVYATDNFIEFDWVVGPLPVNSKYGKEVITRYKTNLKSNGVFYTDSNGREMLKRVRNFRPTWSVSLQEPISGNYYPVTSKILIRDPSQNIEVAVLNDRAQGGSSLKDGQIELMIHRNCMHDDAFGVGEPLIEEAFDRGLVARGTHWLVFGNITSNSGKSIAAIERDIAQKKLLNAWTFLAPGSNPIDKINAGHVWEYSGLNRALPDNVQILTLEPWAAYTFLLRLEHVLEKNEDPTLSKIAEVDLKGLFSSFNIKTIKETTLGGNQWIEENERLVFDTSDSIESLIDKSFLSKEQLESRIKYEESDSETINNVKREVKQDNLADLKITLHPMQIRTFIIEISPVI
ncbi:unnamed protein product [Brassicogethes aeneus]|uniref:Alpha-mannosidase n=1 Tax=Brassicogethes aeneus TaxID=1431903 RepID=A0A9P0AQW0_BRAAE|nr:unnamed protein product [Brassicogethes aeneus]